MALINPYINFNGNAEDAFHFSQINFWRRVHNGPTLQRLGQ